jgi:DNA-binding HxlR family transcriptional regulator
MNSCNPDGGFALVPVVKYKECPIHIAIQVLGKKWALLILRDIAILNICRFNQIKRSLPGLTSRVLILRLRELEEEGYIMRTNSVKDSKISEWVLTEKGADTIPILVSFIEFGIKWCADQVFDDKKARTFDEVYTPE